MKIHDFSLKKEQGKKIVMLTCYDYPSARLIADTNIDCVLVGDSVAMTMHGHKSTIMATMEMMLLHTSAVSRGLGSQFLISDLPFLAHRTSWGIIVDNVKALMQAGAHAIKLEGADVELCQTIKRLVTAGIPIMGHIGLTPQSIHQLGGHKVQGRQPAQADALFKQAQSLQEAGCFAIVIECVPGPIAHDITKTLTIPTIGIGAGPSTDGQVLVWHDLLGLQDEIHPRFVEQFAQGRNVLLQGLHNYARHVENQEFPLPQHTF